MFEKKEFEIGAFTFTLESYRDKTGKEWAHFYLPHEQAAVFAKQSMGDEKAEDNPRSIIELVRNSATDRRLFGRYFTENKHPDFPSMPISALPPGIWVSFDEGNLRKSLSKIPLFGRLFKRNSKEISEYLENRGIPHVIDILDYWRKHGNEKDSSVSKPNIIPETEPQKKEFTSKVYALQTKESDYLASISNDVLRIIDGNIYKPSGNQKPFVMRLKQGKNRQDLALEVGQFLVQMIQNDFRTMTSEEINPIYKQIDDVFNKTFNKEGVLIKGASVADIGIEAGFIYERIVWPERAANREKQPDKAFLIRSK